PLAAVRLGVAQLRVDEAVEQVRLPPIVPAADEPSVLGRPRPADDAELSSGHTPHAHQMACGDGSFGAGGSVTPLLFHDDDPASPGTADVSPLPDPRVHSDAGGQR